MFIWEFENAIRKQYDEEFNGHSYIKYEILCDGEGKVEMKSVGETAVLPYYYYYHCFDEGEIGFLFNIQGLIEMDISGLYKGSTMEFPRKELPAWKRQAAEITSLSQLSELPSMIELLLLRVINEFSSYFMGELITFTLPIFPTGTAFQEQVWKSLMTIPYGEVISYKDLALKVNNPKGMRAIGAANGKNPLPIIIPCHRVIQTDQTLGGYSGGIAIKIALLEREGFTFSSGKSGLKVVLGQSVLPLE